MENKKIQFNDERIIKVEINNYGDYIVIAADDPNFFDRFQEMCKIIIELSENASSDIESVEKEFAGKNEIKYKLEKSSKLSELNIGFSEDVKKAIESVFGNDLFLKYFKEIYKQIPDFLPDGDCLMEFIDQITPIIEEVFEKKLEARNRINKERMKKYKPQDFSKR